MKNISKLIILLITILTFVTSCTKEPAPTADHESINRVILTLTSAKGNATLTFNDADGDGGIAPVIEGDTLMANTLYTGDVTLFSLHDSHYEELTPEIVTEGDKHQFFYTSSLSDIIFSYLDKDVTNNPIGLKMTCKTVATGSGNLNLILRHEPNKSGAGVSTGNILNAGGETDVEITFPLLVK